MHHLPYKQLAAWQKGMEFVPLVYRLTSRLPSNEQFGLTSQLRRASVSIVANLAEGQARESVRTFAYHVGVARGSLAEVETLFLISLKLEYLRPEDLKQVMGCIAEMRRILTGLSRRLLAEPQAQ
ncbi:MAG: four helix bundle protein [Vulcanimicrobiota bacterium]